MTRILNWLFGWPLIREAHPLYVIVYDQPDEGGDLEWYYGYFTTPDEARRVWECFAGTDHNFTNVKLCRVVESWR